MSDKTDSPNGNRANAPDKQGINFDIKVDVNAVGSQEPRQSGRVSGKKKPASEPDSDTQSLISKLTPQTAFTIAIAIGTCVGAVFVIIMNPGLVTERLPPVDSTPALIAAPTNTDVPVPSPTENIPQSSATVPDALPEVVTATVINAGLQLSVIDTYVYPDTSVNGDVRVGSTVEVLGWVVSVGQWACIRFEYNGGKRVGYIAGGFLDLALDQMPKIGEAACQATILN